MRYDSRIKITLHVACLLVLTSLSLYIGFQLIDIHPSAIGWAVLILTPHQLISGLNVFGVLMLLEKNTTSKLFVISGSLFYTLVLNMTTICLGHIAPLLISITPIVFLAVLLPLKKVGERHT